MDGVEITKASLIELLIVKPCKNMVSPRKFLTALLFSSLICNVVHYIINVNNIINNLINSEKVPTYGQQQEKNCLRHVQRAY